LDGDALEEQRRAELKRLEALVAAAEKVQRSVGVDDVEMPRDDADIERILVRGVLTLSVCWVVVQAVG
jgi:hypothetical protein